VSKNINNVLPQVSFNVLFALSLKPRHGYEIIQQIEEDTNGRVRLGPGALYGSLKHLDKANLIEEMPFEDDSRRRYYRLTRKGWDALQSELDYLGDIVRLAKERRTFS
jgi:DNA-binding PadR family transcriptional regulator